MLKALGSQSAGQTTPCITAPRMPAVLSNLQDRSGKVSELTNRLMAALNYVVGEDPPSAGEVVSKSPPSMCFIGSVEAQASDLYYALDALEDQVRRLERVVG
jgi:hypothetical protein